jgi:hypothetical protein
MNDLPWGVSPGQALAFEAYIAYGTAQEAATRLKKSVNTIQEQVRLTRKKMIQAGVIPESHGNVHWLYMAHEAWRNYWQALWEVGELKRDNALGAICLDYRACER